MKNMIKITLNDLNNAEINISLKDINNKIIKIVEKFNTKKINGNTWKINGNIKNLINEIKSIYTTLEINHNETFISPINERTFPIKEITEICSIEDPNAIYRNAFVENEWDGKIRLLRRNKEIIIIPNGLTNDVIEYLNFSSDTTIVIIEHTIPKKKFDWKINKHIIPRKYQIEAMKSSIKSKKGIIQLPTGSGKTIIASLITQKIGLKTLICVHTIDLLNQAYNTFKMMIPNANIGIIGNGKKIIGDITIATIQSLCKANERRKMLNEYRNIMEPEEYEKLKNEKKNNMNDEELMEIFDSIKMIIWDEVHLLPAFTFYRTTMNFKNTTYKIGMSATPRRDDGLDLKIKAGIGEIIYKKNFHDMIKMGYLCPCNVYLKKIKHPENYPNKFKAIYSRGIIINTERNIEIVNLFHELNGITMVLVKYKKHADIIHSIYREKYGINIPILHGKLGKRQRKEMVYNFKNNKILRIIATTLADIGLDIPHLNNVIIAGGGKSSVRTLQRAGRVMRIYPDKKVGNVYDFIDDAQYLYEHSLLRKDVYEDDENGFNTYIIN